MSDARSEEFTQPFWTAIRAGRLLVPECGECGNRFFTPEPLCIHCGSPAWDWAESPGSGTIYSVSVVHQPVNDDHPVPFALTIVDLDDGWSMLTHVVGIEPTEVRIGMRVQVKPSAGASGVLPVFRPQRENSEAAAQ